MMRLLFVFLLSSHSILAASSVVFKSEPGKIAVEIDGKPFTNYYYNWKMANPFLHPLRSTTGLAVTRGFPVEKVEGESSDHIWHHGLWYSHGDINDVDFWRETTGDPFTGQEVSVAGRPHGSKVRTKNGFERGLGNPHG